VIVSPLIRIESAAGKVQVERTATGWFYRNAEGMQAQVRGFRDGIACRIAPGADAEVVQLGIGPASSGLCNAIYSPRRDYALVFTADKLLIEPILKKGRLQYYTVTCDGPLTVTALDDYLRIHRNLPWFKPLRRRRFRRPPAGWCSWYYYYLNVTEAEVVKNTDWLAENLKQFGCEWVQIDDGWQGRGTGFGSNRDWFEVSERDFPQGMKWIANYIRARGLRPGIWCIPFTQSDPDYYRENPELFVRRADGSSPGEHTEPRPIDWLPEEERIYDWAGRYYIDPTGPEGNEYLRGLFNLLCKEWDFDYVKIDAQGMMVGFYQRYRKQLADPSLDGDRAYRTGLQIIRSVMGPNRFLLNCAEGWSSCGLCDGIRIGGDVVLSWAGMQPSIESTMRRLFLNTLAFYTDPDVVCVREPLPFSQAELWATLLGITGQLLMTSDKMYELPDERVELLRRIFPVADIHPMELYPLEGTPGIFDLKVQHPTAGEWDVVALFNWDEVNPKQVQLSPGRLGLPTGDWLCLDGRTGELLHFGEGLLTVQVPPTACRIVTYWPVDDRPRFVGSSRHLTQGADDVEAVKWEENRLRLSGVSHVVGGDPYRLRVYVPDGYRALTRGVKQEGVIAELQLTRNHNTRVRWRIDFSSG